jgi:hypothetical protein
MQTMQDVPSQRLSFVTTVRIECASTVVMPTPFSSHLLTAVMHRVMRRPETNTKIEQARRSAFDIDQPQMGNACVLITDLVHAPHAP